MKKVGLIIFTLLVFAVVYAHELWLQPQKYRYESGETMIIDCMEGKNFEGNFWDFSKEQVEKASIYNRISTVELLGQIKKTKGKNIDYTFNNVGTHLVSLESNNVYSELDPEAFNSYLEEEGLDYVKDERTKRGEENKKSRENYKRFAKLLVQVGDRTDDTYKKSTGQRLEIFPLQNPYDLNVGDYLDCKLLYRGNPEPHALVKVWSHIGNRIFLQNIYTENDGTIRFPISNSGSWMVGTVKMIRSDQPTAEWQSLWSSLVFEIK